MAMVEAAECYIFVDHSNLWIAGQTAQAKKLKDADSDSRYRVDLGKFLHLLVRDRHLSKAFLSHHRMTRFGRQQEKEISKSRLSNTLEVDGRKNWM